MPELASVFFANGEEFLPPATSVGGSDARDVCYATAIATELVLKAFLLTQGWTDARCRRDIRHDLKNALVSACAAGLPSMPDELAHVLDVLNAYYPKHAFNRFVVPANDVTFAARACSLVADLFEAVRPYVQTSDKR